MLYFLTYGGAEYYIVLEWFAAVTAVVIAISSLDDLFIDVYFWVREVYRNLTVKRLFHPLTTEQLQEKSPQPFAIMIPAWREADVIALMLETMVSSLDYRDYVIFVGTYPNDPRTVAEVERMRRRYKQLQRVELPHGGPTSKADCLNWVIQAIFHYEEIHRIEFAGVVLHDCEDVVHPMELYLLNYLLPRKDLVQLPVVSLERHWYELVASTYMDEFAEWHGKDLPVRESLSGMVPSAGVGTGFSRRALLALCAENAGRPFNVDSLTEDYDIGLRLSRLSMKSIFVRFPVRYEIRRRSIFGAEHATELQMPLCVREYFPDSFRAAYRQKARWTLGIALQSWRQIGWPGSLATKYLLFRDRKTLVTSLFGMLAYVLVIHFLLFYVAASLGFWTVRFPPVFADNTWLEWVLIFNLASLILRAVQRGYFVSRIYGFEQGLLSVPRMVVCTAVNFMAAARAWRVFIQNVLFGTAVTWDKTAHVFPTADQLLARRRRLGDLLMSWQVLDGGRLQQALAEQAERDLPLGRILISQGWLDDEILAEAIAVQSDLPRFQLTADEVKRHGDDLPRALSIRHRAISIGLGEDGQPRVAVGGPLSSDGLLAIGTVFGAIPQQYVARESEITSALRLLSEAVGDVAQADRSGVPLLGDLLIERRLVKRADFEAAMEDYRPERDGRIGDHLVTRGVVTRAAVEAAFEAQRRMVRQQVDA
ncbi:glycosyl transferase family protein [Azorhizobium doebereinerae]|uniref:glycosyl transferase family protein n=1 Tax=Azorhizobium doebereinerae TaxID=281091 RepID=UPI00040E6205|nr:glycosyl transferase family protein [Azorhizobium doebereinerae]